MMKAGKSNNLSAGNSIHYGGDIEAGIDNILIAQKEVNVNYGTHIAGRNEVLKGQVVNLDSINIKAGNAVFIISSEVHAHNSKVSAPDIYLLENCVQDIDAGTLEGNLHLVNIQEMNDLYHQYN